MLNRSLNPKNISKKLKKKGFVIIKNFISKNSCNNHIKNFNSLLVKRVKKKMYVGKKDSIVLYNYFNELPKSCKLFSHKIIDKIMIELIDKNYVLISSSARNKTKFNLDNNFFKNSIGSGTKWHNDNRFIGGRSLNPSINYFAIIALEDFTKRNGATLYIPNSHKYNKKINIKKPKNIKSLEVKKGSLIIMDSNLYHKSGKATNVSRWSVFNLYSPWFVKPYFQFYNFMKNKKITNHEKKLLHFNSIPPNDQNVRINTLS